VSAVPGITLPFFILVLAGWLAARRGLLPAQGITGLNVYVLYLALPCMCARLSLSNPLGVLFDARVLLVYGLTATVMALAAFRVALHYRVDVKNAAFSAAVAAFPNTGFMGIGMLMVLLGPQAAGTAVATVIIDIVYTTTLCIALAESGAGGGRAAAVRGALRGALLNPLPGRSAAGALMPARGLGLPGVLDAITKLLADSSAPVALVAIGAVLGATRGETAREPIAWIISFMKVAAHPFAVWAVAALAGLAGLGLGRDQLAALMLVAALPSAGNVMMLAARSGAHTPRIARIVLITTVCAALTFTALAGFLSSTMR
jgi:predicted permease